MFWLSSILWYNVVWEPHGNGGANSDADVPVKDFQSTFNCFWETKPPTFDETESLEDGCPWVSWKLHTEGCCLRSVGGVRGSPSSHLSPPTGTPARTLLHGSVPRCTPY